MELFSALLGWAITTCLFVWLIRDLSQRSHIEHEAHRKDLASLNESHRQEVAQLNQARIEEVSNLLQRIQAPQQATAEHAGRNAIPDPPPLDYEDDAGMIAEAQQRMDDFASDLERLR